VISWFFKEWLTLLEASSDPDIRRNFEDYYTTAIKPFLMELDKHSDANPAFMTADQKTKLNAYLTNIDILYDDLNRITTSFFSTLFNTRTYSNWNVDKQDDKIANYLKSGDYKFKNYPTFNQYLTDAAREKSKYGYTAPIVLTDLASLLKYFFISTAVSTNNKENFNTIGGDKEEGGISIDDLSMANKVTSGRESQGQAWVVAGQVLGCLRSLYHKMALKEKKELSVFIDNLGDKLQEEDTIKNLSNIKKKMHLLSIAKFISGQQTTSDPDAIPEDNISDKDFGIATNPTYTQAGKDYERNYLARNLLKPEKMSAFFDKDSIENPDLHQKIRLIISILYYIGILKNMQKDKSNPFGPEEKKSMRKEFISMLPNDISPILTDDYLKEFSSMSASQLPAVTYPASIEDLKNNVESGKFDGFIKNMFLSTDFPSSYRTNKRDARGELSQTREKEDIIAKFLQPIFDTLVSRTALEMKPDDDDKVFDTEFEFNCQKYLNKFRHEGII
jgi:hypothetical protein